MKIGETFLNSASSSIVKICYLCEDKVITRPINEDRMSTDHKCYTLKEFTAIHEPHKGKTIKRTGRPKK